MKRIDAYVNLVSEEITEEDFNMNLYNEEECPVYEQIEVPKALGDLIESLIGAVFLDSNGDLVQVWKVVRNLFGPEMQRIIDKKPKNFTAR